ncbi:MAG: FAD-dependent oxidoreductase [Candidatus Eremiobacteraeota bacterium]|nr:FAD-dependent oxidoreductase [Candidatus Eremiobacteraeota bacterium]
MMARTALTRLLQQIHLAHAEADATGIRVDEVFASQHERRLQRKEFLAGIAGASATLLASCSNVRVPAGSGAAPSASAAGGSRVVIVGGGLAGVSCAYRLSQAGVPFTLCEANSAFGGRTWTLRGFFDHGQIVEHGGEFISSEHTALRSLAHELGLSLVNLRAGQPKGTDEIYWVQGGKYTVPEMLADYGHVYPAIAAAAKAAGYPVLYNRHTKAAYELDHMSVRQWVEANVPGGLRSRIGWLLDLDCTTENGGESSEQSSLELIQMLNYYPALTTHGQFYLVGTDELFGVVGGNDQVVGRMVARLPAASVRPNMALRALARRSDGSYLLTFGSALQTVELTADHVVLAIPFTTLRQVDLSQAGFSPLKITAINELPLGTNTKLHAQFTRRVWYPLGYNGYTYSDTDFEQTWEVTRRQPGPAGILTSYYGGNWGASFRVPSFAPATPATTRQFLRGLELLYPGCTAAWNGKAYMDYWTGDPWHHGSYSYGKVGQYTKFIGIEGVPEGNVRFAGEHVSIDFAGFMNGAVETGETAASAIAHSMGLPARA